MAAGRSSLKSKQKFGGMKIVVGYTSSICDSSPFFQVSTSTNNIQRGNLLFFVARVVLCFNLFTRATGKLFYNLIGLVALYDIIYLRVIFDRFELRERLKNTMLFLF
jgi:hypothetical protein